MEEEDWNRITYQIFSALEKEWLKHSPSKRRTRILTIDGGGIKSLMTGQALLYLEHTIQSRTSDPQARISDFFDVVAGTGFGGILAAMLVLDDGHGRPLYSAQQTVDILLGNTPKMFKKRLFRQGFSGKSFEAALRKIFSKDGRALTLKDTLKPLLIPCYDLDSGGPFLFSRAGALGSDSFDFELWRICRGTAATPEIFQPARLSSIDGRTKCKAVDGGLVMNNPAAAAVTHVMNNGIEFPHVGGVQDLFVLSLGTATFRQGCSGRDCPSDMVQVAVDGVSDTVDQMMSNAFCATARNYVRIQANGLPKELEPKLNRSLAKNIRAMKVAGERLLKERCMETEPFPFGGKKLAPQTNRHLLDEFIDKIINTARWIS